MDPMVAAKSLKGVSRLRSLLTYTSVPIASSLDAIGSTSYLSSGFRIPLNQNTGASVGRIDEVEIVHITPESKRNWSLPNKGDENLKGDFVCGRKRESLHQRLFFNHSLRVVGGSSAALYMSNRRYSSQSNDNSMSKVKDKVCAP